VVTVGQGGLAACVFCGGETKELVERFTGRTKEGIGMGSAKTDVIKVFGEPTEIEKLRPGEESLLYAKKGLRFRFKDGKVIHMTVRFFGEQTAL
jgi:hypothetical protein